LTAGEAPGVPAALTAGETPGVPAALTAGEAPGVPAGLTAGEAPGVPVGFTPIRFGGTDLFAVGGTFGGTPGVTLAVGGFCPGLVPGFTKFGGVCFCPATGVGEPVPPGVPPWLRLAICGFTKGVGFGRSFGTGFCSTMVFLSFSAS
jgi:hypothetical protein